MVEHAKMMTPKAQIAWGSVWGCGDDPPQASSINQLLIVDAAWLIAQSLRLMPRGSRLMAHGLGEFGAGPEP